MECLGTVVHVQTFTSKKDGKIYSKLFVPIGYEVVSVVANGDLSALAGVSDVPFRLGIKDKELRLYYDGEEE